MISGFCPASLEYCSAVWCSAADAQIKLLDRAVSGARFLTGGVFECDISHRRSVAVMCMLYKVRCDPVHPLNRALPNQKFIVVATSRMIGIHRSSVDDHRRPLSSFQPFPMPEVPLSRCWSSSEMTGILCFKIVGIPIKACAAQLSFNVFPLTNQYWHH